MHAHRIDVLDRADDDAVVALVAHHLHLEFLPAEHRLFDQHFAGGGGVDAALDDFNELRFVVGDAAAGAPERERRADDRGQADVVERGVSRPIFFMVSRNRSRSSALSMASAVAPIILTLNVSSVPIFFKDSAQLSAVCPPMVGSKASGRSFSMILATISGVIGSI